MRRPRDNCPINVNMQNTHQFLWLSALGVSLALSATTARSQERVALPDKPVAIALPDKPVVNGLPDKPVAIGKVIQVGATRDIHTLRQAAKLARDGDTIEVDSGDYKGDNAVWTQNDLIIRGTGARPRLMADGQAAEEKGIFVIKGGNVTIENLGFFGARVRDRNGAGIRLERGRLRVVKCAFEGNENGILTSNNSSVELEVSESTFLNNGAGDGQSHHLYAGRITALEVTGSYFGPARTGHLLKSRAKTTSVLYNRLTGEGGTSSYEIDIPNGGDFKAIGNLVQQGSQTENYALISYGAEGYRWPSNRAQIVFNTLVNDRAQGGVFITMRAGPAEGWISNNLLVGRGEMQIKTPATVTGNAQARPDDFVEPAKFDYRLRKGSKLFGTAGAAGTFGKDTRPTNEYRHMAGSVDLGLTELTPLSPGAFQRLAR